MNDESKKASIIQGGPLSTKGIFVYKIGEYGAKFNLK